MRQMIIIVFILAAVLVSCSQQELKRRIEEDKKISNQYRVEKTSKSYKVTYSYERSLDTIKVSDEYVIIAVYNSGRGISTVVIGRTTRLD